MYAGGMCKQHVLRNIIYRRKGETPRKEASCIRPHPGQTSGYSHHDRDNDYIMKQKSRHSTGTVRARGRRSKCGKAAHKEKRRKKSPSQQMGNGVDHLFVSQSHRWKSSISQPTVSSSRHFSLYILPLSHKSDALQYGITTYLVGTMCDVKTDCCLEFPCDLYYWALYLAFVANR